MANCMTTLPLILALCAVSASALELPLNVDCGTSDIVTHGFLGMTWVADGEYVKSGQLATVRTDDSLVHDGSHIPPLTTLRYFPKRKKNCYSFPGVGQGNKILVRAWFYHGNYDNLSSLPTFDLLFNGNLWAKVVLSAQNLSAIHEMVHVTKVDDVSVCLARTNDNDVPFINSLEIKKLKGNMYAHMEPDRPLYLTGRYAYGSPDKYIRYPNDSYDRLWFGFYGCTDVECTNEPDAISDPVIDLQLAPDDPPAAVVRQAIKGELDEATDLTIPTFIEATEPVPHYVNLYFVETVYNRSRWFELRLDGQTLANIYIGQDRRVKEISRPNVNLSVNSSFHLYAPSPNMYSSLINAAEFFRVGDAWRDMSTDPSDVKALSYIQDNYEQLHGWSGDPCLPTDYAWEWVGCSNESMPQVTALNLSGYGLTGLLVDFSNLSALKTIDLHNNSLSGSIPEFLGNLPNLWQLNLADNQFNGSLPESLTRNSKIHLNISGNNVSGNNVSGDNVSANNISGNSRDSAKKTNARVVVGATIASLLSLLLLVIIAIFIFKQRPSAKQSSVLLEPEIKQAFSHAEIVEITNNFEKVVGKGGSGNVYYGRLRNGPEVAVKVLKDSLSQRTKEFIAEAKLLMTVHHRCLVSFVGYCEEDGKLILLCEYMSGGNLRQLLSGGSSTHAFLTWEGRLRVALSVATGLDYLHSGCNPSIIHRDVKTTNILLNGKMEAKVADFGLSKAGKMDDVTQLSTLVAGTPGYIDPEYYNTSVITKKSDVYSFGVVLFELITGRPPFFDVSENRFHIVQWATASLVTGDIDGIADPKLRGQYNVNSMWKVADIAMSCTSQSSHSRPHMSNVVDQLKEAVEAETYCQQKTDTSFTEVQLSSSSSHEVSRSFPSGSLLPPAR